MTPLRQKERIVLGIALLGFFGSFAFFLWVQISNNFAWNFKNLSLLLFLSMLFGLQFLLFGSMSLRSLGGKNPFPMPWQWGYGDHCNPCNLSTSKK